MKNIRLLEDRVARAVKRLGQLSAERERLEEELRSLRRQAEGQEPAEGAPVSDVREESWNVDRARVVAAIRETLRELRAE